MKRLVEAAKRHLEVDDFVAGHGWGSEMPDGRLVDDAFDDAKAELSRLVSEPAKVYVTVVVRDLEDWGTDVSTSVFSDPEAARRHLMSEIAGGVASLGLDRPGPSETAWYEDLLLARGVVAVENDEGSITFRIEEQEVDNGQAAVAGERQ